MLIDDIKNGRKPVIYGDGRQSRDFIYAKDTARASILALEKGKSGEVYNVGTGRTTDFNTIFEIVKMETRYEGDADHIQNPLKNYQLFTQADLNKTSEHLGFRPEYDIRRGIREILNSF